MLKKLILVMITLLITIMLAASIISLKIKQLERKIANDYEEIRSYEYKIQGLKGQFNTLSTPIYLEKLAKIYVPSMRPVPLRDNIESIPLQMGIKRRIREREE